MHLSSPAFQNNEPIPERYTCDGEDIHPPLHITDVPEGACSLALIVHDPDAPRGDWVHWTLWNIPPETRDIREGEVSGGATEGMTDFGRSGYGGPCPPSGEHRYRFHLYALDAPLTLQNNATRADLDREMNGHVVADAELVGRYQRGG